MYSLKFDNLVRDNLPVRMRLPVFMQLAQVLISPVASLYDEFIRFKASRDLRLNYNSRVCLFEEVLNLLFDKQYQRIYITGTELVEELRIGNRHNLKQVYVAAGGTTGPAGVQGTSIGNRTEYAAEVDFIVHLPGTLVVKEAEIRNVINDYRLAGKTYKIQYV